MKLMFVHNADLLADLNESRDNALGRTMQINKSKKEILDRFVEEMREGMPNAGEEFYRDILPRMASFGGKISGESRRFKSDLIMYILTCLSTNVNNRIIFDYYTSMNYAVFSKLIFNSSPTKSDILQLLNHGGEGCITWQEKNVFYNEFSRKDKFLKYCKYEFTPESTEEFVTFFIDEYANYKSLVSQQNEVSKSTIVGIKGDLKKGEQMDLLS